MRSAAVISILHTAPESTITHFVSSLQAPSISEMNILIFAKYRFPENLYMTTFFSGIEYVFLSRLWNPSCPGITPRKERFGFAVLIITETNDKMTPMSTPSRPSLRPIGRLRPWPFSSVTTPGRLPICMTR